MRVKYTFSCVKNKNKLNMVNLMKLQTKERESAFPNTLTTEKKSFWCEK